MSYCYKCVMLCHIMAPNFDSICIQCFDLWPMIFPLLWGDQVSLFSIMCYNISLSSLYITVPYLVLTVLSCSLSGLPPVLFYLCVCVYVCGCIHCACEFFCNTHIVSYLFLLLCISIISLSNYDVWIE